MKIRSNQPLLNSWGELLPLILFPAMAVFLSLTTTWTNDALAYKFFSPVFDESTATSIHSLKDVFLSQADHYITTNGRFAVHILVQIFCALLGHIPFAICQGIVWFLLIYLSLKFTTSSNYIRTNQCWLVASLLWIIFSFLPMDPPFQINYVWVAAMLCGWLMLFFSNKKINGWKLIALALYSLLCGSLHEGSSIPIAVGVFILASILRFKLSKQQYIVAIFFCIGTIVTCVAPGNFVRLSVTDTAAGFTFFSFIHKTSVLICLLLLLFIYLLIFRPVSNLTNKEKSLIILLSAAAFTSFAICCYLGYFSRAAIPCYFYLTLILLIVCTHRKPNHIITILLVLFALGQTVSKYNQQQSLNGFAKEITEKYRKSQDGIIYVKAENFTAHKDEICLYRWAHEKAERINSPNKPVLVIRPDFMADPKFERDTNLSVQIGPQAWILIQSKTHPAVFKVEKTLLPGIVNKGMSPRELIFTDNQDITFDTLGPRRAAIYFNKRPFIKSEIRMVPTD